MRLDVTAQLEMEMRTWISKQNPLDKQRKLPNNSPQTFLQIKTKSNTAHCLPNAIAAKEQNNSN